jgi:hypothetical protein
MGETFRGQQVAKMLGLNKGTEKVLTSVFGKQIGKDLIGSSGTTGSSSAPATTASPVNVPANTKIEPMPSNDPKKLQFNIGGATFTLDTTDPKNNQTVQQLQQQLGQQR